MLKAYEQLTCDICGEQKEIPAGALAYGWYKADEVANGENGDRTMYYGDGTPLYPTKHICPVCAGKLFGDAETEM